MQADLINAYKCLMRENKEDGAIFFSVASSERTRGNRHKLKYKKFYLNTFMTWMIESMSSQNITESSLEIL